MTDPIRAALERLHQYAEMFPEHDTDEILAAARALLAEQQGEGPSESDVADLFYRYTWAKDLKVGFENAIAEALARWGHQPTPPAEGEVAELVAWLHDCAKVRMDEGYEGPASKFARAAELLQQQHPTPVPVSEGLQPKDCDAEGRCWWLKERIMTDYRARCAEPMQKQPPAEGEIAGLVVALKVPGDPFPEYRIIEAAQADRIAALLEQQQVAKIQELEALPLPQGEVE